jgi:DNA-binding GntR family transcriptional regulator
MVIVNKRDKFAANDRVGSPKTLSGFVCENIRERLRDGRLQPGDRLNVVKLAAELEVSRTPVQEAVNRLEQEGLLIVQPHQGAMITNLEPGQATELYIIRELLQGKAARLAAQNATNNEIHALREILDEQNLCIDDTLQFVRLNQQFHDAIFQLAHNRYLLQAVGLFHTSLALLRSTNVLPPGRAESAYLEHVAIVEALENRDPDAAENATLEHIRASERLRLKSSFAGGAQRTDSF